MSGCSWHVYVFSCWLLWSEPLVSSDLSSCFWDSGYITHAVGLLGWTISNLQYPSSTSNCVGGLPLLWSPLPTWWASGDGRSTGVIALWRVGNSRVARAAEWSRVPWRGGRGSGGEDEQSSIIRFNYNLLYAYPNHSMPPSFILQIPTISFLGISVRGEQTICCRGPCCVPL